MARLIDGDGDPIYAGEPITSPFLTGDVTLEQITPGQWLISSTGGGGGALFIPSPAAPPPPAAAAAAAAPASVAAAGGGGAAAAIAGGGATALLPAVSRILTQLAGPAVSPSMPVARRPASASSMTWLLVVGAVVAVVLVTSPKAS